MKAVAHACDRCKRVIDPAREITAKEPPGFKREIGSALDGDSGKRMATFEFRIDKDADVCARCQDAMLKLAITWVQDNAAFLKPWVPATADERRSAGPIPASRR